MADETVGRRIGHFSIGLAAAAFCGFVAWLAFALMTMMVDPTLAGDAYWNAVRQRMTANPGLSALFVSACVGVLLGAVLMGRAGLATRPK